MEQTPTRVTCCIAGCGPAGAMLGLLLARAGVDVLVLEKHGDFLRDFRGDTLHPSTLRLFDELGLAEALLRLPHQETQVLGVTTDAGEFTLADFGRLPGPYRFLAFMPQWDFLDFVVGQARRLPSFELRMEAEAVEVLEEAGRVAGVLYRDRDGAVHQVQARLTVAADGRDSELRRAARLRPTEFGVPIDVLWFRLPRRPTDAPQSFGRLAAGHLLVLIDRGAYWQIAYLIPKAAADELHRVGLDRLRASVAELVPFLADRVDELRTWDDLRTLRVQVDRLRRWFRPGLLCIGDAAHAMSPIGGVGINLAVHDAVAAANHLAGPLRDGTLATRDLARVQLRRLLPTVVVQWGQRTIQDRFLSPLLAGRVPAKGPLALRVLRRFPVLQAVPALVVGIGVLPEHVRTPALQDPTDEGGLAGVLEVVGDHADQPHPEGDRRVP
jgi:2-polyprenyl-6-methoxyphenol hydroxylase-like FAD-dependent oxidoreductase